MSDATIAFYAKGSTHHATGRVLEWLPGEPGRGRHVAIETDDGQRLVGLVVPERTAGITQ